MRYIIILLLLTKCIDISANHLIGGQITYEIIDVDLDSMKFTINIEISIYGDLFQNGAQSLIPLDNSIELGIFYNNSSSWNFNSKHLVTSDNPSNFHLSLFDNSQCLIDNPERFLLSKKIYRANNLKLDIIDSDYRFTYQRCCKSESIVNILDPGGVGTSLEFSLSPEQQKILNSSPTFNIEYTNVVCSEIAQTIDFSVTDIEGDELEYSFCEVISAGGEITPFANDECEGSFPNPKFCGPNEFTIAEFVSPTYSYDDPLPGSFSIDPKTGIITGEGAMPGTYVFAVCVSEYRINPLNENRELLGQIKKDYVINIVNCRDDSADEEPCEQTIEDNDVSISKTDYDNCETSFRIDNPNGFCGDFTTTGSTMSDDDSPSCWPIGSVSNDIWISFTATRQSGTLTIFPQSSTADSALTDISVGVYSGRCNNLIEVECSSFVRSNSANEVFLTSLIIGATYYVRINSRNDDTGSFRLCTQLFNPVPEVKQDCFESVILCDRSSFVVEFLTGAGTDRDEADDTCLDTDPRTGTDDGNSEDRSAWYSWTCKESGTLFFTLTPNNTENIIEDLDFVLYRLPNGLQDCTDKELLRCMASGETLNQPFEDNLPCLGVTGLRPGSNDLEESRGCQAGDDNFLAPITMEAGESFALLVNNFSSSDLGFSIEFGGTGTFLGPEPEFEIDILASASLNCDQEIVFRDQSTGSKDSIIDRQWNFGLGATPSSVSGAGPHRVQYNTFGTKTAVLTVETKGGCLLTYFEEVEVGPCCPETTNISLNTTMRNVICNGDESGRIDVTASAGNGDYLYSFNNGDFLQIQSFDNLAANTYFISVIDDKGCTATIEAEISQPPPFTVDAGVDQTIKIGQETIINASIEPPNGEFQLTWSPTDELSCTNCAMIEVAPLIIGSTIYTVIVTNQNGCTASDKVIINAISDITETNAFTPDGDGDNDLLRFTDSDVIEDSELWIYNRWGDQIYKKENYTNDWDGGGFPDGVYYYILKVGETVIKNSLTILR